MLKEKQGCEVEAQRLIEPETYENKLTRISMGRKKQNKQRKKYGFWVIAHACKNRHAYA